MQSKLPIHSRTLWSSIPGSLVFLGDALHGFLTSGIVDNVCAQKSALAGGLLALVAFLRFYTSKPITTGKEPS